MAVRVTINNARAGKNGVFLAKHLDSPDGKAAQMGGLLSTWHRDCKTDKGKSFEQVEADFYEAHFRAGLDAQNERHKKGGHKNRMKNMDEYRTTHNTAPECSLSYLGDMDAYNVLSEQGKAEFRRKLLAVVVEFWKWRRDTYPQVVGLDMALHVEDGAPHVHERHVWVAHDADGNEIVSQEKALEEMGVPRADEAKYAADMARAKKITDAKEREKKISQINRYNNRKMTYSAQCREKMIEIAKAHGIEVIEEPREAGQNGLSHARHKTRDEQRKQREAEQARKAADEAAKKAAEDRQRDEQAAQQAREWVGQVKDALDEYSETTEKAAKETRAAADKYAKETRQAARADAQTLKQTGYEAGYAEGKTAAQKAAESEIEAAKQQGYLDGYEAGIKDGYSTPMGRLAEAREQAEARAREAQDGYDHEHP